LHRISSSEGKQQRSARMAELIQADQAVARLAQQAQSTPQAAQWRRLTDATQHFTLTAKAAMANDAPPLSNEVLESLFDQHDAVVKIIHDLIQLSSRHLTTVDEQMNLQLQDLASESAFLLSTCFLLAAICAGATIAFVKKSIQRIEWQRDELNRVSWHMLQTQEETARRFSHELHDELGQSLAAVRANLTSSSVGDQVERRADCVHLVDEAIANVRELSQLLRPVILDDFGLEAGLRWLSEKFSQRTRVKVAYECTLAGRLLPDTETHLFRIAQEALTNIARHSQATKIFITLAAEVAIVRLVVQDDGCGISPDRKDSPASLGLIGMRARARECGGTLDLQSVQPSGLRIVVEVPLKLVSTDES
jgi:signal transduction histidine kinase